MLKKEQWNGFKGRLWKEEINVRDFIQNNYKPYYGDESFLAGPTEATNKLWGKLQELQKEERANNGVLDMETHVVSGLTAYGPGYIDEELYHIAVRKDSHSRRKRSLQEMVNRQLELKKVLDGIVNIGDYVAEQVNKAAFSIEFGDEAGGVKPLNLKNGNGDIISSVNIDVESYLEFATSKIADEQDVEDSKGTVEAGHQILILTLTSGSKIYVDLNQLVDVYTGLNTKSITLTVSNNQISADLNISKNDKILYVYDDGVQAHFQVVRQPGKIIFYGKTQTDTDKLAEIQLADTVITTTFIEKASEETYTKYPPRYIDNKPYDQLTNPIVLGTPYFIIVFGSDTGDSSTSYQYNDYISINPILNTLVLSPNEGNIITRDENGYLYGSINWIDV